MSMDIGSQKYTSNNNTKLKILEVRIKKNRSCQFYQFCQFYLYQLRFCRHFIDGYSKIKLIQSHRLSKQITLTFSMLKQTFSY